MAHVFYVFRLGVIFLKRDVDSRANRCGMNTARARGSMSKDQNEADRMDPEQSTGLTENSLFVGLDETWAPHVMVALIESADDAIISKSLDGIITSWNKGAERLFGYNATEAVGQHVSFLIPRDRREEETLIIARILAGERVEHFETIRQRKNGDLVDISLTVSPIQNSHGEIIGASKIAREITEQVIVRRSLEEAKQSAEDSKKRAEEANRLKDEFLATLSHELRTPLTAIMGWTSILQSGRATPAETERGLKIIERNVRTQAQLIEDILDVSRVITGKLRLEVQTVDLAGIIEEAIATVLPSAQAKDIRLQRVLDSGATFVSGDPTRLLQVIWNLLSNSIKFTPKGGRVQIRLERINSHIEVIVSDNGLGIAPEMLPFVFDRFRQADATTTRTQGGLGLGLSIVRHLVEMHGGVVDVESGGIGQGSTFTIKLPLVAMTLISKNNETAERRVHLTAGGTGISADVPRLDGLHILVVDDQEDTRLFVAVVLKQQGASITSCASVQEALMAITEQPPDILLSDIGMPAEDGYSLIRRVRALDPEKGGRIPAVALTAFARVEDRVRILRAGFQTHISKPVDPAELVNIIAILGDKNG
ncbi:MAG: PAS domain-containing hybrid sensor histidine kinase/response regulator [Proteobacteria bacterium]|nr:MAG: PAS domain-containing hybrid sensor histidine kinase/response regulator [Pseudomonadota bacterium]